MNTVAKGNRNEKKCEDELIGLGYHTWRTKRTKFGPIDLFGLFDVAAISPDVDRKTREKIGAFKVPPYTTKEIWVWKDYKGWTKYTLHGGDYIET